jgi:phosphatidylglycerophosphatase A
MIFKDRTVVFLATGLYAGNLPFAPGTFGSVIGLVPAFFLAGLNLPLVFVCVLVFVFFAVWIAQQAEQILKQKDPGCIVIDEIVGMIITLMGLPFNLKTALLGFALFRILDILKPPPVRTAEKRLTGGIGVVADDVIAGILANILLRIILMVMMQFG